MYLQYPNNRTAGTVTSYANRRAILLGCNTAFRCCVETRRPPRDFLVLGQPPRLVHILFAVLGAALVAGYFGWRTESFIEAEDSLSFARRILAGAPFLHPNHLLFEPVYHALLQVVLSVFPTADGLQVLHGITSAFGLGALGLVGALAWSRAWNAWAGGGPSPA